MNKIKFIRHDLSRELFDHDILLTLKMHPSGYVQRKIQGVILKFQYERVEFILWNLTLKNYVCQFEEN